jgi:hypothetical protein
MKIIVPAFFLVVAAVMAATDSPLIAGLAAWVFFVALVLRHFAIQARSLTGPDLAAAVEGLL